jgi:hypothetical protein
MMVRWCLHHKNEGATWVINIVQTLNRRRAPAELASPEPAICCITHDGACSKVAYFRGASRLAHTGVRGSRGRISPSPASRHRGFGGAICPCRRHLIRCCAAMAFACVQSVLMSCCDLIVSSCLMMVRLLGDDKNKLLVWLWLRSVKQWRRSLCRLSVLYCSARTFLFFKMFPMSHLHGLLAKSAILSQPRRVEVMNRHCPIGQRYG